MKFENNTDEKTERKNIKRPWECAEEERESKRIRLHRPWELPSTTPCLFATSSQQITNTPPTTFLPPVVSSGIFNVQRRSFEFLKYSFLNLVSFPKPTFSFKPSINQNLLQHQRISYVNQGSPLYLSNTHRNVESVSNTKMLHSTTNQNCSTSNHSTFEDSGISEEKFFSHKYRKNTLYSPQVVEVLERWYQQNLNDPYLNKQDLEMLNNCCGLDEKQIRKWLSNRRHRDKNTLSFNKLKHPSSRKC